MQNDDAIATLNNLIAIAKDGVSGMSSAADNAKDPSLKATLQQLSQQRGSVAAELQGMVRGLGGAAEDAGTTLGAAHRAFMNVKDAVTGYDDAKLLEECERGEDHAVAKFREAIGEGLPPTVATQIQSCFDQVKKSHEQIRALRNTQR